MQVNVLRNIIFAFYIFKTNGFPDTSEIADQKPQILSKKSIILQNDSGNNDFIVEISGKDQEDEALNSQELESSLNNDKNGNNESEADEKIRDLVILTGDISKNKQEPGFDLTDDEMLKFKIWPNGLIPYYIDVLSFSVYRCNLMRHGFNTYKALRDKIRSFLSSVNSVTSLNFVELHLPPEDDSRWVFFINRRGLLGCADHSVKNFTNTGVQKVILGYECMSTDGELAEAVLAIAGVPAQHNAPDRDYYIKVNNENIMPDKKYLFEKLFDDEWLFHDLQYDFNSVGHYHSHKYSVNGRATIEPQENDGKEIIGESVWFTAEDILKIKILYNFIVKKKQLQAPDCHKLFIPGSKFNQYKPSDAIKPRPKSYKYIGEGNVTLSNEEDVNETRENYTTIKDSNQHENIDVNGLDDEKNENNNGKLSAENNNVNDVDSAIIENKKSAVNDKHDVHNYSNTSSYFNDEKGLINTDKKEVINNVKNRDNLKKDKTSHLSDYEGNERQKQFPLKKTLIKLLKAKKNKPMKPKENYTKKEKENGKKKDNKQKKTEIEIGVEIENTNKFVIADYRTTNEDETNEDSRT